MASHEEYEHLIQNLQKYFTTGTVFPPVGEG